MIEFRFLVVPPRRYILLLLPSVSLTHTHTKKKQMRYCPTNSEGRVHQMEATHMLSVTITDLKETDGGNYTCSLKPDLNTLIKSSVTVVILPRECFLWLLCSPYYILLCCPFLYVKLFCLHCCFLVNILLLSIPVYLIILHMQLFEFPSFILYSLADVCELIEFCFMGTEIHMNFRVLLNTYRWSDFPLLTK